MADVTQRLIIGISGASGVIYGIRALELLRDTDVETHLVMSKSAEMTMGYEVDMKPSAVRELADVAHAVGDVGASISFSVSPKRCAASSRQSAASLLPLGSLSCYQNAR